MIHFRHAAVQLQVTVAINDIKHFNSITRDLINVAIDWLNASFSRRFPLEFTFFSSAKD